MGNLGKAKGRRKTSAPLCFGKASPKPPGAKEIKQTKRAVMPSSHLNDPEYWRDRAKEARALVEDLADPVSKQKMLEVAASYEHLAKRAEDRGSGKAPKL